MGWDIIKSFLVFLAIVIGFILILLLPREMSVTHHGGFVFTADFPFSIEIYKERIKDFIVFIREEKGFGNNHTGMPISEEVQKLLGRSLQIIIPAFILSIIVGTFLGIIQFYFRDSLLGKIQAFFSWFFSSIPDFFLFIAIQYLLIKLFHLGVPRISLYGNDHWYNFIVPLVAVTLFPLIHMVKFTAATLENEVGQDYVRTAKSKGLQNIRILIHKLWNCWYSLLNQTQFVMLYILSSLPIIEKLSSYKGAGVELLNSIMGNQDMRALAIMIPFLLLMFTTILFSKIVKHRLLPQNSGELR
jgi:oligopeptide transport system permease protein